jgi:hypothetical protein
MSKTGTIDRIVDLLKVSRDEKISQLDGRYNEHKQWMADEFENVRALINQSSSAHGKKAAVMPAAKAVPISSSSAVASSSSMSARQVTAAAADPPAKVASKATAPVPAVVAKAAQRSLPSSTASVPVVVKPVVVAVKEEAAKKREKRKSPETAINQPIEKLSPENKRTSSDFEKIVLQAGLPSDLNRLKKDALLKELATRGHFDLSMKSLKKDMVEALRGILLEQGKATPAKVGEEEEEEEEEEEAPSESSQSLAALKHDSPSSKANPNPNIKAPAAAANPNRSPVRKVGSSTTMSDIRKELNSSTGASKQPAETEEQRKKRTEEEFKRRLSNNQARRSLSESGSGSGSGSDECSAHSSAEKEGAAAAKAEPSPSPEKNQAATAPFNSAITPPLPAAAKKITPAATAVPAPVVMESRDSDIMFSEDGSTWMEVASPQPVHSLANLKTNIASETNYNNSNNLLSTPATKSAVFIKTEKGLEGSSISGAVDAPAASASATVPGSASAHWSVIGSAAKAANHSDSSNAHTAATAAAMTTVPPAAPTPGGDKGTTATPASAVKSSAKKAGGLFSFLSTKVKEEKMEAPPVHSEAAKQQQQQQQQMMSTPGKPPAGAAASGSSSALRSAAKQAQLAQQQQQQAAMQMQQQKIKNEPGANPYQQQQSNSPVKQGADEYKIDDRDDSGASDSGTDDEGENKSKQNKVPEWARGVQLKEQLERQYGLHGNKSVDPDLIFPEVQTCSLEEIFGANMGKSGAYNKRSSSAHWDADEITLVEKRTYRAQMGLSAN